MFKIFTKLGDLVAFDLLALDPTTHMAHAIHFFVEDTVKLLFLITVLMTLVGFMRSWLSPEKVRHWLQGKPKWIAYLMAVSLGAITPFCSCSSIPLFIAFLSTGIPLGVTMAFLITSPMVNEVAAVLFGEAIGLDFTIAYVVTGMVVGMVGGFIIDLLKLDKWVEPFVFQVQVNDEGLNEEVELTIKQRLRYALNEAVNLIKQIWLYIIIGVGVGAAIHGFVPQEWFLEHAGAGNLFAVPLAVILAVPLYSNVTGTIPVAEVLIAKGLPVGTTLAFIMSTVAISLPEIMILRKVLKPQMLVFFVAYIAIAFILVGYGFNWLF